MIMLGFWEVMDRCDRGPLQKEKQYDMQIARTAREQAVAFDIRFDPESVIPDDDDLADRLYRAAVAFFVENGVYCRDTGRLVRFSRREVEEAVKNAPRSITYGQGKDTAVMTSRKVEDAKPPFITMTPVGTPVAEERFVAMMQSFVQEPLAQPFPVLSVKLSTAVLSRPDHPRRRRRPSGMLSNCGKRPVARGDRTSASTTWLPTLRPRMPLWRPCSRHLACCPTMVWASPPFLS
jgi:methylamine--corrinoid protein Co-methyltransferase